MDDVHSCKVRKPDRYWTEARLQIKLKTSNNHKLIDVCLKYSGTLMAREETVNFLYTVKRYGGSSPPLSA